jgi:hypothetical protein
VRSLKKVIEASELDKTSRFGLLHLPSEDVLKSHVEEARVNVFLEGLGGASHQSDDPLPLQWRRYEPSAKDVDGYADKLVEEESKLARCLAQRTYEKFKEKARDDSLTEYDKLSQVEKDRFDESALSAIRNKRGLRADEA